MTEQISWDDAVESSVFVKLKKDEPKNMVITNWRFEKRPSDSNIAPNKIEFKADVLVEDDSPVDGKLFTTTSKRLKERLKPILESKQPTEQVKLSIIKVGEQFNTEYSVRELTGDTKNGE